MFYLFIPNEYDVYYNSNCAEFSIIRLYAVTSTILHVVEE